MEKSPQQSGKNNTVLNERLMTYIESKFNDPADAPPSYQYDYQWKSDKARAYSEKLREKNVKKSRRNGKIQIGGAIHV